MKPTVALRACLAALVVASVGHAMYMVERKGKFYHRASCPLLRNMDLSDLQMVRSAKAAAVCRKVPCPFCKPPMVGPRRKVLVLGSNVNFVGDTKRRVYHRPDCPFAERIDKKHRTRLVSIEDVRSARSTPCKTCKPPSLSELVGDSATSSSQDQDADGDRAAPSATVKATEILSQDIVVPGNRPWTSTNVKVLSGHIVMMRATGRVQVSPVVAKGKPLPIWGPDGTIVNDEPLYCLMARVGNESYVVGRRRGLRFKKSGVLQLGFKDSVSGYPDNAGGFRVRVVVLSTHGSPKPVSRGPGKASEDKTAGWWQAFRREPKP